MLAWKKNAPACFYDNRQSEITLIQMWWWLPPRYCCYFFPWTSHRILLCYLSVDKTVSQKSKGCFANAEKPEDIILLLFPRQCLSTPLIGSSALFYNSGVKYLRAGENRMPWLPPVIQIMYMTEHLLFLTKVIFKLY